jgi:hypothetical protein
LHAEERHCETLPLASLGQLFKPREALRAEGARPGSLVEDQLAHAVWDFGRRGERRLSAVGVAEEKDGGGDGLDQRHDIQTLIFEAVPFGHVRFPPAATGDCIHCELLF